MNPIPWSFGKMELRPVTVAIGRTRSRCEFAGVEFRDPPEGFADRLGFQLQLTAVLDVLEAASSAEAENGAGGIGSVGGGGEDIDNVGAAVIFRCFGYFAEDFFAGD